MSSCSVLLIASGIVLVAAVVALVLVQRRRTERLRRTFGPEYDYVLEESDGRWQAERELRGRLKERNAFELRPLTAEHGMQFEGLWKDPRQAFVDSPAAAVGGAHGILVDLLTDRGYPSGSAEDRLRLFSVDHPDLTQGYRDADRIRADSEGGAASTDDLRVAMEKIRGRVSCSFGAERPTV